MQIKIKKQVLAILLTVLALFLMIFPSGNTTAHAATTASAFEQTNVLDDLKDCTIDGEPFDLKNYSFNRAKPTQVLMLVEYCYSFYWNRQDNYGLYLYVWNPQGIAFNATSTQNAVQLAYTEDDYVKYPITFLNCSMQANYEGLFYKYKIDFSKNQKEQMLDTLNSSERTYHISGIELVTQGKDKPHEYPINAVFTYSGYAQGYGPNADADTLTYTRGEGDVFVIKDEDLHQTFYRPKGTDGSRYQQDTLHTVYFTVPNSLIDKYGRLAVLRVQWLEAVLNPFFVTGNKDIYDALQNYLGKTMGAYDGSDGFPYGLLGGYKHETHTMGGFTFTKDTAELAYNPWYAYMDEVTTELNRLCMAFFSGSAKDSADSYTVSAEQLIEKMKQYSLGSTNKVLERYDRTLFSSIDSDFTVVDIPAEKEYSLTSEKISQTFWEKLVGKSHVVFSDTYDGIQAIYPVKATDFGNSKEQTCQNLYIDVNDYDEFKTVYDKAVAAKETVYLFRFAQSKYSAWEVTEGKWKKSTQWVPNNGTVGGSFQTVYSLSDRDTNAYFAQETVYLGLDLIQMEWDDGGKRVVIPIVSSPIDVVADATPPVYTTSDKTPWWKILLAVLAIVLLLIILFKFAPWIFVGLFKLIALPFKALGALFKSISRRRKERKEQKARDKPKETKAEKKARKRQEKKARKTKNTVPDFDERMLDEIDWDDPFWSDLDNFNG